MMHGQGSGTTPHEQGQRRPRYFAARAWDRERKAQGVTRSAVADEVGRSPSWVHRLASGRARKLNVVEATMLATLVDTKLERFISTHAGDALSMPTIVNDDGGPA